MKPFFFTIIYLLFIVLSLIYTKDLEQVNHESLFLTLEGRNSSEKFTSKIKEERVLVSSISLESHGQNIFGPVHSYVKGFKARYPQLKLEMITFEEVLPSDKFELNLKSILKLTQNYPQISIPLITEKSYSLFFLLGEEMSSSQTKELIENFRNDMKKMGVEAISFSGMPYVNYLLDFYSAEIKSQAFPLMFLICLILTLIFTRSFLMTFFLFVPSFFSFSFSLLLIKFFITNLDMISSVVPLLVFVLNLSLNFHLYFHYLEVKDFNTTVKEKLIPISLMILTTGIGFGTLYVSDIIAIKQFSYISSLSLLITSLFSLFWFYGTCSWWVVNGAIEHSMEKNKKMLMWIPNYRFFVAICLVIVSLFFINIRDIEVVTDATKYFPKNSPEIIEMKKIQQTVLGNPNFEILISKKMGEDLNFNDFKKMKGIEETLMSRLGPNYQILSANKLVEEANCFYINEKVLPLIEPPYLLLYSKINEVMRKGYPLSDVYRITLLGPNLDKNEFLTEKDIVSEILSKETDYQYLISGVQYHLLDAQNSLVLILAKSFLMSLVIIIFLVTLYFKKIKIISLFLVINLVPMMFSVLFFKIFDLSLNVATIMTFSIALGIIVDSTIHISYNLLCGINRDLYFRSCIRPILMSSIILIIGFLALSLNRFLPIRQVGLMLALNIFAGLLFDLYGVPLLLKENHLSKD